ncbi:MAG: FAD-dependent oxidoreductase [Pseudomonadota bacterium]
MKIAVIGSGIAGSSAAWALGKTNQVTLYEKRDRLGGHSATVDVVSKGQSIPVDTGFIVYNELNYPLLTKLFDYLQVETQRSKMTFSVSLEDGKLEWCGSKLRGVFAQPSNLLSPGFLRMLRDIFRFNKRARMDLQSGALCGLTLNDYLHKAGFSKRLKNDYLVPMTSAIWSTPSTKMLEFPAESLIRFMKNHALIQKDRPRWRTVTGGSREYVKALSADTEANVKTGCGVTSVKRTALGVEVLDANGNRDTYDQVIMACHSDQAIGMLDNASEQEREILGSIRYIDNDVWLHQDPALMPKRRNAWASWNYLGSKSVEDQRDVSVTYWMNQLQSIDNDHPLFVTLNPLKEPQSELVHNRFQYSHPLFDSAAIKAQERLHEIQGKDGIWFCGAWCGYGFHEDGLRSGLDVAKALGCSLPWEHDASTSSLHRPANTEYDNKLLVDAAE